MNDRELTTEEVQWMHDKNDELNRALDRIVSEADARDDITELGGLSADERDQLAVDLCQEQDLERERGHVTDGSPCWCGPTTIDPDGSGGESGANPVLPPTPASTSGPGMTIVNATNRRVEFRVTAVPGETSSVDIADLADLDPDTVVPGVDATTGLSLHTPITADAATSGADPWDSDELRELVQAAGVLHFAYHEHQAMLPDAVNRLMSLVREYDREQAELSELNTRYVEHGPIQPLNDQVFLVRVQPPDRTASGLAIPESAQSKGCECRVLAAGPGAKNARTGKRIPMSVTAEDRVVIGKWQGNEVTIPDYVRVSWGIDDREPVIVVRETEILAVLAG